jgi:hypothetical protein
MFSIKAASSLFAAALLATFSASAFAAPTYTPLGDSGTLQVTTYAPVLQVSAATVPAPFGPATVTAIPNGFALTYTLNSDFFAAANNAGGGEKQIMSGKLDFNFSFDNAVRLTASLGESGVFNKTGVGEASIFGGMVITSNDAAAEQHGTGLLGNNATFNNANGSWSSFAQVAGVNGFTGLHQSYRVTVDNDLIAFAPPSNSLGSAAIAKKQFTIFLTTDGSIPNGGGPNIPEPASLSLLAVGTMALVSRRRRA